MSFYQEFLALFPLHQPALLFFESITIVEALHYGYQIYVFDSPSLAAFSRFVSSEARPNCNVN